MSRQLKVEVHLKLNHQNQDDENIPQLEITELVSVHCNLVDDTYQHDARVLYTFIPNKSFGQLLEISPNGCDLLFKIINH